MILEHVAFKLIENADRDAFLRAANDAEFFLSKQPGFIKRELYHNEADGTWLDLVWWEGRDHAQAAAQVFPAADECKAFLAFIPKDGLAMAHLTAVNGA